jgi:hypothetical protein
LKFSSSEVSEISHSSLRVREEIVISSLEAKFFILNLATSAVSVPSFGLEREDQSISN